MLVRMLPTIYDMVQSIGSIISITVMSRNMTEMFKIAGLLPFKTEDIFGNDKFLPSFVIDKPITRNI